LPLLNHIDSPTSAVEAKNVGGGWVSRHIGASRLPPQRAIPLRAVAG
jgi:hypothetical protein